MIIGLHDSEKEHFKHKKTFPNYALMKISAYNKAKGDSVEWWDPAKDYDLVYSSKIFDFTEENKDLPPDTIKGGTGYDIEKKLPQEIDDMYPDYSIYPDCDYMCCNVMKKKPAKTFSKKYDKKPIIGTLADESRLRKQQWMKNGCNGFDMKAPVSNPLSFWVENDILQYIAENNLEIAKAYRRVVFSEKEGRYYTTGCQRTGCIFCLFGITQDRDRIARLQIEEPKLADYVLRGGEFGDSGYWQPSNNGLGYWFIIDWLKLHGLGIECYRDIDYAGIYGNERTRKILLSEKIKAGMKKMEVSDDCND